jgi:DNA-binding FrmR family transcriptional regulator
LNIKKLARLFKALKISAAPETQKQLRRRLARLGGQVKALDRMVEGGDDWRKALAVASAAEGALDQVIADLMQGYLQSVTPKGSNNQDKARYKEFRQALNLALKRL